MAYQTSNTFKSPIGGESTWLDINHYRTVEYNLQVYIYIYIYKKKRQCMSATLSAPYMRAETTKLNCASLSWREAWPSCIVTWQYICVWVFRLAGPLCERRLYSAEYVMKTLNADSRRTCTFRKGNKRIAFQWYWWHMTRIVLVWRHFLGSWRVVTLQHAERKVKAFQDVGDTMWDHFNVWRCRCLDSDIRTVFFVFF